MFCSAWEKWPLGFFCCKVGKWADEAWRDMCIHNTSASFLSVYIVWCCGSSLLYCLVSSAGGLSCKQLKGEPSPFSFSKELSSFFQPVSLSVVIFLSACPLSFCSPDLHHTPTHTNIPALTTAGSGSVPEHRKKCIGALGASGEGRILLACQCLWPLCHNGSLSPPTHFPAKLGRVNIYHPPQQWPAWRRKRLWSELMQGLYLLTIWGLKMGCRKIKLGASELFWKNTFFK